MMDSRRNQLDSHKLMRWRYIAEPNFVFSVVTLILLALVWGTYWYYSKEEEVHSRRLAEITTQEIAESYEAHVVRVLSDIDQTLTIIQYAIDRNSDSDIKFNAEQVLTELGQSNLLPPDTIFTIKLIDSHEYEMSSTGNLNNLTSYPFHHGDESIFLGLRQAAANEWLLQFGRPVNLQDKTGFAIIELNAGFFVSAYRQSRLGLKGVLGLLNNQGRFLVRRSGNSLSSGTRVDYESVVNTGALNAQVRLGENPWDNERRYTIARPLHRFPITVVVGLSETEQLGKIEQKIQKYFLFASIFSLAIIGGISTLWYLNHQLTVSRRQAYKVQLAHADEMRYLALHDPLTKLWNRNGLSVFLSHSIKLASRHRRKLGILFIDLDRFKIINDSLGHDAGDKLLMTVAERLQTCVRESDTVARISGDEFVILLSELVEETYVLRVAEKVLHAIAQPIILSEKEFLISGSVGIATYPADGNDEESLLKSADTAMYAAKHRGRNNFAQYSSIRNQTPVAHKVLQTALQQAVKNNEFKLFYQAKYCVHSGQITGAEALLRWQHPELGIVCPLEFIPIAENMGLMQDLGTWVLLTACRQAAEWQNFGFPALRVSINLTSQQFLHPKLTDDVKQALSKSGLPADCLELEISENVLMGNADTVTVNGIVRELHEIGIRVVIDDFGAGLFSLAMLGQYAIDTVKIDRSCLSGLSVRDDKDRFIDALIEMGQTLSRSVVAQGVETVHQVDYLRNSACAEYQGNFLATPLAVDEFERLLQRQDVKSESVV